jgi:hypothetical protein
MRSPSFSKKYNSPLLNHGLDDANNKKAAEAAFLFDQYIPL